MQRLSLLAGLVALWLASPVSAVSDCDGCFNGELPVDEVVLAFFAANAEFRSQAETVAQEKGMKSDIMDFSPVRYKTQIARGVNWFVKVQLNSWFFADAAIFQPVIGEPELLGIKFGVPRDAAIDYVAGSSVV